MVTESSVANDSAALLLFVIGWGFCGGEGGANG
jgi:hypothetical protein